MKTIEKYGTEYRYIWIHSKLVNYFAIWASPKYASTVGEIMDKINERVIAEHNADPDTPIGTHVDNVSSEFMNYQQEKIDQLREEKNELRQENGELREQNNELHTE
ncbi:MAG: hypothetical protein EZS28_046647, partial [Streblomastix strix]